MSYVVRIPNDRDSSGSVSSWQSVLTPGLSTKRAVPTEHLQLSIVKFWERPMAIWEHIDTMQGLHG